MIIRPIARVADPIARWGFRQAARRLRAGSLVIETPDGRTEQLRGPLPGPEAVLRVNDPSFYRRFLLHGEIGFGEAYQQGLCDSPDLVALLRLALANRQVIDFNKLAPNRPDAILLSRGYFAPHG